MSLGRAAERTGLAEKAGRLSRLQAMQQRRVIASLAKDNEAFLARVIGEARAYHAANMPRGATLGFPWIGLLIGAGVSAGGAIVMWGWKLKNQTAAIQACQDCMDANGQNANLCQSVCGELGPDAGGDSGTFQKIGAWAVAGIVGAIVVSKVIDKTL